MNDQLQEARASAARATTAALHDIADGWRTLNETTALVFAAKEELERRHPCHDCGAPAGRLCRPEYGCSPKSRRAYTEADTIRSTPTSGRHGHPGPSGPIPAVDDRTPDNDTGDELATEESDSELTRQQLAARSSATVAGDDSAGEREHNRRVDMLEDAQRPRLEELRAGRRLPGIGYVLTDAYRLEPIIVTLDAMEPADLLAPAIAAGIAVTVHRSGLAVTLDGPRAAVRDLIAEQWGDDDQARELTSMPKDEGPETTRGALLEAADACETLASIDEGEHTDTDRLRRIAGMLRIEAGE